MSSQFGPNPAKSTEALVLLCPVCREPLLPQADRLDCQANPRQSGCLEHYRLDNGFPDLIIGERFDDPTDEACMCYEEYSNDYTARHYWIPTFRQLFPDLDRPARILALGCGTGVEVDLLNEAGFDCYGIDNGNRTQVWPRRCHSHKLFLANGLHLPFADGAFDAVFCGCVFPHVGVVGDSNIVADHGLEDRRALAREMGRVLIPGGRIVVSSPNRRFPFDIFHGRQPGSYKPVFNPPGSRFLLSVGDYAGLFRAAGCRLVRARPVTGYWGFVRSKNSLKGQLLGLPVQLLFWLVSRPSLSCLRGSPLSPWLVVEVTK